MTSVAVPICYSCVHLDRDADDFRCAAYPTGIPDVIVTSEVDHRLPYTGDNGIHFEQDATKPVPDETVFGE